MDKPRAKAVWADKRHFVIELQDGRQLSVPCEHFAWLSHADPLKISNIQIIDHGAGLHWPDLNENLSIAGLLCPNPCTEAP